jgi:hypothetical protein
VDTTTTAVFLNEYALGQHLTEKHFSLHTEHYGFTALVPACLDMLQGRQHRKDDRQRRLAGVGTMRLVYRIYYRYTVYWSLPLVHHVLPSTINLSTQQAVTVGER